MKTILVDLIAIVGFSSIVYGTWLINQPLAFIVAGVFCLVLSIAWGISNVKSEKTK